MSNVSMIDGHIDEPKKITRFEKIKRDLTIEQVAKHIEVYRDNYCFEMCEKETGYKYRCPHDESDIDRCYKCALEWLQTEVDDGE